MWRLLHKTKQQWLTKFQTPASHAAPASTNAPLRLFRQAISMLSTLTNASIAVHAQAFARAKLSTPNKTEDNNEITRTPSTECGYFLSKTNAPPLTRGGASFHEHDIRLFQKCPQRRMFGNFAHGFQFCCSDTTFSLSVKVETAYLQGLAVGSANRTGNAVVIYRRHALTY